MTAGNDARDAHPPAQIIRQKLSTVEQAEAFFEKHHDPWKLRASERMINATTTLILLGDLRFWRAGNRAGHELIPGARPSRYLVNILTAGSMEARFGGKMERLSEGRAWIRDSATLEFVRKHPGLRMTSFDIPRVLLDEHLARVRFWERSCVPSRDASIDATQGNGKLLLNLASFVIDTFDTSPTLPLSAVAAQSFINLTLDILVNGVILNPTSPARAADSRTLKRAVDFIESNLQRPIAILDVAEAAGVGPRALQLSFRREFGCSPLRYARRRRLAAVRHELVTNGGTRTIAEVAARWGFIHFGLFAQQYRETYGERPSETKRGPE